MSSDASKEARSSMKDDEDMVTCSNDIRSCGNAGDLQGAMDIFDRLGNHTINTLALNSILGACMECKQIGKAIDYFSRPELRSVADVVSYGAVMLAFISNEHEIQDAGAKPST